MIYHVEFRGAQHNFHSTTGLLLATSADARLKALERTTWYNPLATGARWIQVNPGARYKCQVLGDTSCAVKLWHMLKGWEEKFSTNLHFYLIKIQLKIPTWQGKHGNTNNIWPITLQGAAIQYPELQKSRRVRSSPPCRILSLQAVDPSVPADVGTANCFNEPCTKVMLSQDS